MKIKKPLSHSRFFATVSQYVIIRDGKYIDPETGNECEPPVDMMPPNTMKRNKKRTAKSAKIEALADELTERRQEE